MNSILTRYRITVKFIILWCYFTCEDITIYSAGYDPTRQMINIVSFGTVGQQPEKYDFGRREA